MFIEGAGTHAGFATVVSPLFTMWLLLCLSGIPQAEGQKSKRWYDGGEALTLSPKPKPKPKPKPNPNQVRWRRGPNPKP